jgi:predicted pyridoxine 5'-phosphate oxidase superfamily flavin-nucleotide-binding protein
VTEEAAQRGRAFATFAFTPAVKAAQERYGARRSNLALERIADRQDTLGTEERHFIEARDSFYQATVTETGWPYVQFRGGPVGFLRVVDEKTIGFADFRGNAQYLSVGNLNADPRVALILLDYSHQRRLKVWGRANVVDASEEPALAASLTVPGYRAKVERAILISVEAFDWNCPQHITPRFTSEEVEAAMARLRAELIILRQKLAEKNRA